MKKFFLSLAVFVMALCANAQTNQYFWYNGNLMMGNPIAQIDSVTFGNEDTDSIMIYLPRTIIKEVHDTLYITIHDTICPNDVPEGALNGIFSVSADKKVRFSKGNLQYQASTDTWRFAENQWDYVGNASLGTVYEGEEKCNNALISNTYTGWIDYFEWGTGDNPSSVYDNRNDFVDWGQNIISNGGNLPNLWHTLTKMEWHYLFYSRNNASILFGFGSIGGINGLIILPDDWSTPQGIVFTPSTEKGLENQGVEYYNSTGDNFSHNTYTFQQWKIMEKNGAIFFPAAGGRGAGYTIISIGEGAAYWSSSPKEEGVSFLLDMNKYRLAPLDYFYPLGDGRSVRLVQDAQ